MTSITGTANRTRSYSFDILRLLACFTVVLCHISHAPINSCWVEPGSFGYNFCVTMDALTRWNIAVFVMLSGFFLVDPRKEMPLKTLFSKYILRVVGALVIWSVFYALMRHVPVYPFGSSACHLWYLPMIIGVYLSIPIFRLIVQHQRIMEYFLIVWLFFLCYLFLGQYFVMPFDFESYPTAFIGRSGFAVYAYYLKKTFTNPKDEKKMRRVSLIIYFCGILGLLVTIVSGILICPENPLWSYASPSYFSTVTAVFVFAIRHPLKLSGRKASIVETCAKCSFGVYLVHLQVVIEVFWRLHRFIPSVVPLVLVGWVICVGVGLFITYLLRLIPGLKRIMV